jgi:di/tricarboxylate transporter
VRKTETGRRLALHPVSWVQYGLALAIVWVLFYFFARFLGEIPDAFHDGTIWE